MKKINILGTEYTIEVHKTEDDPLLGELLGYADESVKLIVIAALTPDNCEMKDIEAYERQLLRHEIIHAFLSESGMGDLMTHDKLGHDEQMIDWFARQSPKIFTAFQDAGCE